MRRFVIVAVAVVAGVVTLTRSRSRNAENEMWSQITDEAPTHAR